MTTLGLRNGEARALDARDYTDGQLMIGKAMKGAARNAPIRAPKNGRWRRLPVSADLAGLDRSECARDGPAGEPSALRPPGHGRAVGPDGDAA
jgi:hypothetical protein